MLYKTRFLISHRPGQGHFKDSSLVFSNKYPFDFPLAQWNWRKKKEEEEGEEEEGEEEGEEEEEEGETGIFAIYQKIVKITAYALTMFGWPKQH